MIAFTFDLFKGTATLATPAVIKAGTPAEPLRVAFSAAPGIVTDLTFGLATDTKPRVTKAFLDVGGLSQENAILWTGFLDANDTRLVEFMAARSATGFVGEFAVTIDGNRQYVPDIPITVQPAFTATAPTTEGGPVFVTEARLSQALADLVAQGGLVAP